MRIGAKVQHLTAVRARERKSPNSRVPSRYVIHYEREYAGAMCRRILQKKDEIAERYAARDGISGKSRDPRDEK